MIAYRFSEAELVADIEADDLAKKRKKAWLVKAKELTEKLRKSAKKATARPALPKAKKATSKKKDAAKKSKTDELSEIWGEIKSVYTNLQHGKCIYCERLLGAHELASIEHDVEHFRPKNEVKPWPSHDVIDELQLPNDFPRSTSSGPGYRFLAYHQLNYAVACKTCNSRLKSSYFPIAGKHDFDSADPVTLQRDELPYLIFPMGDFESDPEDLIRFDGFRATPNNAPSAGHKYERGRVTITFFRLNDERGDLMLLRAKQLDNVHTKLQLLESKKREADRRVLWDDIRRLANSANDHAGCVRSWLKQYGDPFSPAPPTRQKALANLKLATDYVRSKLKPLT